MKRKHRSHRKVRARNVRQTLTDIKVFAALSLARREHLTLEQAAKIEGTTVSTIRRRAPSAVEKRGSKYRVKQFDRIPA